jgi:1-acyl-sn-glycerol-3-phosphate acyltransferase
MGDRYYRFLRSLATPVAFRCFGAEQIAAHGPAVFVANHLGSVGPIEAILSVPVRFYPWIRAEMMDPARGPQYLYDDFVHPVWHLTSRTGMTVSRLVSWIAIGIFHGIDAIPVENAAGLHVDAFRQSLTLLLQGRRLLIFPENPVLPPDPATGLRPFMGGFAQLCQMFEHRTGLALPLHPVAISVRRKAVLIGAALHLDRGTLARTDTRTVCAQIQDRVHALICQLEDEATS